MIVLGILLLVVALAVVAFVLLGGLPPSTDTDVSIEVYGLALDTTAVAVFALGALTLLLLELAVLAMRSGARKSARRRAELQRLRRVEAEVQSRQAAEAQRNAAAEPVYAPAAAPFARRESADRPPARPDGDTGSHPAPETHRDRDDSHDRDAARAAGAHRPTDADQRDRAGHDDTVVDRRPGDTSDTGPGPLATPGPTRPTTAPDEHDRRS